MNTQTRKYLCASAALAVFSALASPAHAQLALSYKLDVRADTAQQAPAVVNRCSGFNWMTSIGACGRDLLARIGPTPRSDGVWGPPVAEPVEVATVPDLPNLGSPTPERFLRSSGGKEALIGNTRTADLLFRFGSKFRLKNNDEGAWEWYRFTDTAYDNYLKTNGHKAVGVELLVPFQ